MVDYIWNISFYPCILRPLWASSEYLFGAYLYNLSPINVLGVMEAIKSNASYTNFIKNQSAQNLINAYGFSIKMSEADCVAELMRMYQKLTKEK